MLGNWRANLLNTLALDPGKAPGVLTSLGVLISLGVPKSLVGDELGTYLSGLDPTLPSAKHPHHSCHLCSPPVISLSIPGLPLTAANRPPAAEAEGFLPADSPGVGELIRIGSLLGTGLDVSPPWNSGEVPMSSSGGGASGVLGGGGCWPRRDGWDEDWRAERRLDGEDMVNSGSIRAAGV